jgi:hypothetical protein
MSATGMKMAVEGILSSRETRRNALQGLAGGVQTALMGYREALAGGRVRSALEAGRATLRAEVQRSLAQLRADFAEARMEWQRTAQAAPAAGPSVKTEYVPPLPKAHHQRVKRQA